MTTTPRVLVQAKLLEDANTTQYTSTNAKTIIDGVSVTNVGVDPQTITINMPGNGVAVAANNVIVKERSVAAGATDLLPELRGRRLDAGDFVSTIASDDASLVFRMEGRIFTGT